MRLVNIPFIGDKLVCFRTLRKSCEHFCFLGAFVDFGGALVHFEAAIVILAGKAAFVTGALGVYLLHAEETLRTVGEVAGSLE